MSALRWIRSALTPRASVARGASLPCAGTVALTPFRGAVPDWTETAIMGRCKRR